jgi:GxxExxY protein
VRIKKAKLVYPKISYQIMGIVFRIHRRLGNSYQEKYYQRAIELEFTKEKIPFKREAQIRLYYVNKPIGKYFLDFVIDDRIALEVKTVPYLKKVYINQVLAYLNSAKLKLGIITNFRTDRLTYKRLINPRVKI